MQKIDKAIAKYMFDTFVYIYIYVPDKIDVERLIHFLFAKNNSG